MDSSHTPARPRSHRIGDVGQTTVALLFKRWGWTADLISSDYGEDLDCTVFLERQRTALHFRCQVKAREGDSRGKVRRLQSGGFGVQVASSTATAWALSYFPVLLVVFDEATNQISWANGSLKAHGQMKSSARRSLSIRIPENNLELEQALLLEQLQAHYARLFRLDSAELTCEIYPVLMPGHKAIDSLRKIDKAVESAQGFAVERTYLDIDSAPAWTTAVNTLKGTHLSGWRFSAPGGNVENFLNHLKSTLETISQTDEEQWTAYIRGPVKLQSPEQDKRQVALGAGELTQWSCYSKISGQVVDDAGYAFQLPRGFTRCIARRARSWDGEWSVATHYDLAVQVYSSVPTTPSYRARQAAHRKHAEGQFLVWECNEDSIDVLRKILIEVGLVFREIEVASDQNGVVVGAIATPMFDPRVGLIPMALDWEEYDRGSVQMKLEDAGILSILPGREGSENIHGIVMGMFGSTFADIPSELRTADGLFPPGLPLNHADRSGFKDSAKTLCLIYRC